MEWMIICIVVVGIFCFFVGFGIRRSNNNRQNVRDEVLINDSNNRQNESDVLCENKNNMVIESTCAHEVSLVNTDINKDLSISHSSYQINSFGKSSIQNLAISKTNCYQINSFGKSSILSKTNCYQINSFGKSSIQNLAISKTNCYQINSFEKSSIQNLAISKTNLIINNNIVYNIIDDLKRYNNKGMSVLRQPGIFRKRLEELEKIEKQEIEKMKQRLSRRDRKIKSKIKDMPAPEPIYEDIKEDDKNIKKLDK